MVLIALAWSVGSAAAQEPQPAAVLVGPVSPQIVARVRGQTADLSWRVEVVDVDASLPPRARALHAATSSGARVAFVVLTEEPTRVVIVRLPGPEMETRLLSSASSQRLGESARAEAISLIVRGALTSTELVSTATTPEAQPDSPPAETRGPAAPPAAPESAGRDPGPRLGAQVAFGAGASVDGHTPLANLGPRLRAALVVDDVQVGAEVSVSIPQPLTSSDLVIALLRVELHATFALTWRLATDVGVAVGVGGGATLFERTTRETGPALEATPSSWLVSPSAALEARLGWQLDPHVGLELSLGVTALFAPPSLVVSRPGGDEVRHALWPVGPRGGLAVTFQ